MSAVRNWLRTVEIFAGYLRHMKRIENNTGYERAKDAFADALERVNGGKAGGIETGGPAATRTAENCTVQKAIQSRGGKNDYQEQG